MDLIRLVVRCSLVIYFSLLAAYAASVYANDCSVQDCVAEQHWQLGLALGLGVRTNPLVDGDNIPLVIVPDIAWYGEYVYFDNAELGLQWHNTDDFALTTYLAFDDERAFFSFWNPSNLFALNAALDAESVAPSSPNIDSDGAATERDLSIDDIASRSWALHAGIKSIWRFEHASIKFLLETDVSSTHSGHLAQLSYSRGFLAGEWRISVTPSIAWKSDRLVDYYYGIDARDIADSAFHYQAKSGFQPSLKISAKRDINKNWDYLMQVTYTRLHSGMYKSPIVEQNNVLSIFAGVAYRF